MSSSLIYLPYTYRLAASWKLLYKHTVDYQNHVSKSGDVNNELPLIGKLLTSVQHVLEETEARVSPRAVVAKLSAGKFGKKL